MKTLDEILWKKNEGSETMDIKIEDEERMAYNCHTYMRACCGGGHIVSFLGCR